METLILISLFFCHFLADFTPLSTKDMLFAKQFGYPIMPIAHHAFIHAVLMTVVLAFIFNVGFFALNICFFIQWSSHLTIDVAKGKVNCLFPQVQDNTNKWHWIVFGADQFLHAVFIILMAKTANI